MDINFRPLRADELDVRIGTVGKTGVTFLLYKNARIDMALLDEVVGPMNWQRDHKEIKDNMYCGIGIRDDSGSWVWKWDCGTESNTEAEKGESSDSFKRAGFNWGIGRELYTAPFIFLKCETEPQGNRYKMKNPYEFNGIKVKDINYEETDGKRRISRLTLELKGKEVFKWESDTKISNAMREGETKYATPNEKKGLQSTWQKKGLTWAWLCEQMGWDPSNGDITQAEYGRAMNLLMEYPDAQTN